MSDGTTRTSLPLVLVAREGRGDEDWLVDLLTANRYAVITADSGASFRMRAAAAQPDLIVLTEGTRGAGLALARALRKDGHIDPSTPVLMILSHGSTRGDRLGALQAGVWSLITPPHDPELLLQQVDLFVMSRLDAARALTDGLIDRATMLYNRLGLARRARELGALAYRDHAAIGCLALAVDFLPSPGDGPDTDQGPDITRCVHALRAATRQSDVVGRVGRSEFAIVAPGADAAGCRRLAHRVGARLLAAEAPRLHRIRGGYDAVFNAGYAPFAPVDLLVRASTAMRTGEVEQELDWLRRYPDGASA